MNCYLIILFLSTIVACTTGRYSGSRPSSNNENHHYSHQESRPSYGRPNHNHPTTSKPVASSSTTTARTTTSAASSAGIESRSLDEIYAAALAEGGRLIIYAGGDTIGQQDARKNAFEARFPGMTLDMIVDLSKFHDGRIDNQLATDTLIPDIAQLQTLQDFTRWRDEDVLMNYKPASWEHVYDEFKDEDGAFMGVGVTTFGIVVNTKLVSPANYPRLATDLLKPEFKNRMITTYPNDDDAVLFYYKLIVDKYGWDYVRQLAEQNVTFVRGTAASTGGAIRGDYAISIGTWGPPTNTSGLDIILMLETDPFMSWAQRAAIFKDAAHPEAAKLYMNWVTEASSQVGSFSVRDDVPSPTNKTIWDYSNTNPVDFIDFMEDRAGVEQFKTQITLYLGEVEGESPTSTFLLGTHPTEALPH